MEFRACSRDDRHAAISFGVEVQRVRTQIERRDPEIDLPAFSVVEGALRVRRRSIAKRDDIDGRDCGYALGYSKMKGGGAGLIFILSNRKLFVFLCRILRKGCVFARARWNEC